MMTRKYASVLLCNMLSHTNITHLLFDGIVPELRLQFGEVHINKTGRLRLCWMIIRYVEFHIHTIALPKKKRRTVVVF